MDGTRRASPSEPKFDRKRLEDLFNSLDINKDGRIDTNELQKRLTEQGIDASEAAVSFVPGIDDCYGPRLNDLRGLVGST